MTLVVLVATYDTASQAQVRMLETVYKRYTPRLNALVVALEPPHHHALVEAFAQSLGLTMPVALADEATIAGKGPFDGLQHVPSLVLLDRKGRERWRHLGVVRASALMAVVRRYDERASR
jgi:hypothetical protein